MRGSFTEKEKQRLEAYLNIHLKKNERDVPVPEQITALQKRDRNKWWHVLINVIAVLLFAYSFYFNLTQLSDTLLAILLIVFVINVLLIFYQKKQIRDLISYLKWKEKR